MLAAAKARAEEAKARALANETILQQRAQQQQLSAQTSAAQRPATAASASGAAGGLSQLELIRQRKEALQAKLSKVIPAASAAAQTAASSSGSRPVGGTAAASGQRTTTAKGGLGMDMAPMISRDAEGNLIINSVTAGKPVKAPSFATAKVISLSQKILPFFYMRVVSSVCVAKFANLLFHLILHCDFSRLIDQPEARTKEGVEDPERARRLHQSREEPLL